MTSKARANHDGLVLYFILTFIVSWLMCWIPAALTGQTSMQFPTVLLYMLGGFGPSIVGVILTYRFGAKDDRRALWRSLVDFKRISPGWYAIILLIFPLIFEAAVLINGAMGGEAPGMTAWQQTLQQPASLIGTLIIGLVFGPLSEEIGWRGFVLDRMIRRWGLPASALALGLTWWVWHLPLFAIRGTTQYGWGWWTSEFWLFFATVIPLSVLIAWGYALNRRSLLLAVLVHFMFYTTMSMFFPISTQMLGLVVALLYAATSAVILATRNQMVALEVERQQVRREAASATGR